MHMPEQDTQTALINLTTEPIVIVDWEYKYDEKYRNNYVVLEPSKNPIEKLPPVKEGTCYVVSPQTAFFLHLATGRTDFLFPDGECIDAQGTLRGYYSLASVEDEQPIDYNGIK